MYNTLFNNFLFILNQFKTVAVPVEVMNDFEAFAVAQNVAINGGAIIENNGKVAGKYYYL